MLQSAISSYRETLHMKGRSCTSMDALVMQSKTVGPENKHTKIKISYIEYTYQETQNVRDFTFESFFSSIGGFVGIFLGYSMLQIPELLISIPSVMKKLKNTSIKGEIRFTIYKIFYDVK